MFDVLSGFGVVILVIALGYGVGRKKLLGSGAVYTLNMFVFWIALPPMLISNLMNSDIGLLFGPGLAIAALSGLGTGLIAFCGARFIARRRPADALIAMLASSYNNSAHLGIPLAAHILGDPAATMPIILFQVGLYAPLSTLALDFALHNGATPAQKARNWAQMPGVSITWRIRETIATVIRNPLIIGAALGVIASYAHSTYGWQVPFAISEPLRLLAQSAVGVALISFGISLSEVVVLRKGTSPRRSVWAASIMKTVIHPALAVLLASLVFSLDGHALLVIGVIAGLPTGQNVFTYAQRYRVGTVLARDTAVVSTLLSVPTLSALFLVFS